MRRKLLIKGFEVAALFAALGATNPVRAGQLFAFDYSLPGVGATPMDVSASGFFTTSDLSGGQYTINGVYGIWNGMTITGILAPGSFASNDNVLFASGPLLSLGGLGFTVNGAGDDGVGNVNVYYDATQGGYTEQNANVGGGPSFSVSPAAPPSVYFNFNYSIPGSGPTPMDVWASGMLTAFNLNTDGNSYLVTDITGTWNGAAILGLLDPGSFGSNDNALFGADPHVNTYGLSFAVNGVGDDGSGNVNLAYYYGSGYSEFSNNVDFTQNFNLSQVPEPGSVTLIGIGICFFLFLVRHRSTVPR